MTTVYDVPANLLITRTAKELKKLNACSPPEWAPFVKTAIHKERAPKDKDWWYVREAAILRKVYVYGPIGTSRLKGKFSGPLDRGSKPNRTRGGSGSIVRMGLKQLEEEKLIQTSGGRGREITPKGRKLLDNLSYEVLKDIIKEKPELGKY